MRRAVVLLPVLALALSGCSGGGDDGEKQEYVRQAEAVCTKANAAQQAEKTPTSAAEIPVYVRRVVTIAGDASAELDALEPPKKDSAQLEAKFLGPLREQVGRGRVYAKQVEDASAKGDTTAVLTLLGSPPTDTTADLDFLRSYGLTSCADAAAPRS